MALKLSIPVNAPGECSQKQDFYQCDTVHATRQHIAPTEDTTSGHMTVPICLFVNPRPNSCLCFSAAPRLPSSATPRLWVILDGYYGKSEEHRREHTPSIQPELCFGSFLSSPRLW